MFMEMFVPQKQTYGTGREFLTASSTTIKKWDALKITAGYVDKAGVSDTAVFAVAEQSVTTDAGAHKTILCTLVSPEVEFLVDTKTQGTQAQVGTKVKLNNENSIDPTQATGGIFTILQVLPKKKAIGRFY